MTFQISNLKIKQFGHLNSLYTRATRTITNHVYIEDCLRFLPKENFSYPCRLYPIKTRQHILHECRTYNKYWNSLRTSLSHLIAFFEFNMSFFLLTSFYVSNYIIAITVFHCALCNKLLIF